MGAAEISLPKSVSGDVKITITKPSDQERRAVVSVALPGALTAYGVPVAMPHVDPKDTQTAVYGQVKRLYAANNQKGVQYSMSRRLRLHAVKLARTKVVPVPPDADISVESWLAKCPYPQWRKAQLLKTWNEWLDEKGDSLATAKQFSRLKSFIKDETYGSFKHARGINARDDVWKCLIGPYVKLLEESLYGLDFFIKHIPKSDLGRVLMERLGSNGSQYFCTDYTSFESQWSASAMQNTYWPFYQVGLSALPEGPEVLRIMRRFIMGVNVCEFRGCGFRASMKAKRMSGEMDTSLANGLGNYVIAHFVTTQLCGWDDYVGFVEGDDSIARIDGPVPTYEMFAELGFDIKPEVVNDLSSASFCGEVFHPDVGHVFPKISETLVQLFWADPSYGSQKLVKREALLRMKALSLVYQYPGCPILAEVARWILRCTTRATNLSRVIDSRTVNQWERSQYLEALRERGRCLASTPVHTSTRLLVEELQHIPIAAQLRIETYVRGLTKLQPLDGAYFGDMLEPAWLQYSHDYICRIPAADVRRDVMDVPFRPYVLPRKSTAIDMLDRMTAENRQLGSDQRF